MKDLMTALAVAVGVFAAGATCIVDGTLARSPVDEASSEAATTMTVRSRACASGSSVSLDARDVFREVSPSGDLDCRPPAGFYIMIH